MKKIIKYIPNTLSIIRIILIPLILVFTIKNNMKIAITLTIIAAITDTLDGRIARHFNVVSKLGTKLDVVADKLFAGILIISLIIKYKIFIICLIGELLITIINIISFFKKQNPKTEYIGKIKATALYITIIIGFISTLNNSFEILIIPFIIITTILQIWSIITYINCLINFKK